MSRKDFISDHLVDMRSELRDSYASYHQNRAARETEKNDPELLETANIAEPGGDTAAAGLENSVDRVGKYLPSMQKKHDRSADNRERRELEGRIIHDQAALDCEREKLQKKLEELEKFAVVLHSSRQEITGGDTGKIAMAYYAARGRWSAFEERYEKSVTAETSSGTDRKGFWIVAAAVLLGSALVAFALIKSFSI